MQNQAFLKINPSIIEANCNNIIPFNSNNSNVHNNIEDERSKIMKMAIDLFAIKNDTNRSISESMQTIKEIYHELFKIINSDLSIMKSSKNISDETVFDEYIVCLEDGKKLKMLKRHLRSYYKMTFQEYKKKWNLPHDYPSVCKNYSTRRQNIAKNIKHKKD